jgi:hypothetical protein
MIRSFPTTLMQDPVFRLRTPDARLVLFTLWMHPSNHLSGLFVWTGTVLYQLFDGGKVAVMSYACLRAMILKEYAGWLFRLTLHTTAATSAAPPCIQG